jgi:hypothetical protein
VVEEAWDPEGCEAEDGGAAPEFVPGQITEDDYRLLSVAFTVRSVHRGLAEALRWHLEPFHRASPAPHGYPVDVFVQDEDRRLEPPPYSFFLATELRFRSPSLGAVLSWALWDLHAVVPRQARDFLMLHAGAVARGGQAVLLPAPPEGGKSCLVLALLQAGFDYLSDEVGALDPVTERAYPFEKRITLGPQSLRFFPGLEERLDDRRGLSGELRDRYVRPEDVGAGVAGASPVRWVVFLSADRNGPPRLEPVPRAEAVTRMAASAFNLYRYGERGVVLLSRVAREARAFELRGGTPAERAALLAERVS